MLNLTEPHERLPDYSVDAPLGMTCLREPIVDYDIPTAQTMRRILDAIDAAMQSKRPLYLHCHGGIGRTGTTVGCWLVEQGLDGGQALALLARKWLVMEKRSRYPHSPETAAQHEFIANWRPCDGRSA